MSTPNKYSPETNALPPRCPHCKRDLDNVSTWQWSKSIAGGQGQAMMFALYCPNFECRALLSSEIFFVAGQPEEARIARPS